MPKKTRPKTARKPKFINADIDTDLLERLRRSVHDRMLKTDAAHEARAELLKPIWDDMEACEREQRGGLTVTTVLCASACRIVMACLAEAGFGQRVGKPAINRIVRMPVPLPQPDSGEVGPIAKGII